MKTVYADRYALLFWICLLSGAWFLFRALTPLAGWRSAIWFAGSIFWLWLAYKEFTRRRAARRRGEDTAIYKVVDDA